MSEEESKTPRRARRRTARRGNLENEDINKTLNTIYQDDNGDIPDMKKIAIRKGHTFLRSLASFLTLGVFFAAIAWAGFYFFSNTQSFSEDQISIKITGTNEPALGSTSTYFITYNNNDGSVLKNVNLNTYYPSGFIFVSSSPSPRNAGHNEWVIGNLPPHGSGTIAITGQNLGAIDEQKSWRVFLNYTPSNFNSELQKVTTLTTVIKSSPLNLAIKGPDKVSLGKSATYIFQINNSGNWQPYLEISPKLAPNFTLTSSTPALNKNNRWVVTYSASSTQIITYSITGQFSDTEASSSPVGAELLLKDSGKEFSIASTFISPELIKSDLSFNLAINGTMTDFDSTPGDTFNITLRLKNSSANDIKKATVKLNLEAPSIKKQSIINWADINDQYDGNVTGVQINDKVRSGEIIWNSQKIPGLAKLQPNQEINIDVRLPLKDGQSYDLSTVEDPTIVASAEVNFVDKTGANQTVSIKPITITLNSNLKLESRDDVTALDANKENHEITWVINNDFHNLKDIKLTANAFGDITFTTGTTSGGNFTYDSADKSLVWKIDTMPTSVDVLNNSFNITLNKKDLSQSILLSQVHLTATDTVTGKTLNLAADEIQLNKPTN